MKDPRKIAENLTKGAEEVDEQWRPKEKAIKRKYIDPLRVKPKTAIAFDSISIVIQTLWLFYFGYGEAFIISLVITVLLFCSVYSLIRNVSEVAG